MMKEIKQNEKGFTLVELVVVIAILAILAVLIVPRIMDNIEDAKRHSAEGDARTLASEIAVYNATQAAQPTPALIPAGTYSTEDTGAAALSVINRTDADLPNGTYAAVEVDATGDAKVIFRP